MKNGLTTQDVITNTNNYEFTYIYDQESYSVDFSDDNGNIAYGFIEKYDNVTGFALYLNGKTYLLKE